ncbi:MAG: anti-sigma factor antagonist [Planctomycetota bacterium]|nr:MAG: anti-sigma factor antagonist [Planctomycetota bacterium]
MNIETDTRDGVVFITVNGNLDLVWTEAFEKILGQALVNENSRIVFDLSQCLGITSKAIGLLMWAKAETKGNGGDVYLLNPNPKVLSLLKLIGLGDVLQTVNSSEEAIKLLS